MSEPRRLPNSIRDLATLRCGCGAPEAFMAAALAILEHFAKPMRERDPEWPHADPFRYFAVNVMDSLELIQHGVHIAISELTESGKEALAFLQENGCSWDETEDWIDSHGVHWRRL